MTRLPWWLWRLLHPIRTWGPRCRAHPPEKLPDADVCCVYRGHERSRRDDADWHADGQGYIWNDTLGRWSWRGPVVNLADEYPDPPGGDYHAMWTETPPPERTSDP